MELIDARGPGHALESEEGRCAADAALRTEGLVVNPVYTAKALPALRLARDEPVAVFWHTGGLLATIAAATGQPL